VTTYLELSNNYSSGDIRVGFESQTLNETKGDKSSMILLDSSAEDSGSPFNFKIN